MATISQTKPVKQLKELLQQKQDPFVLDLYLVERGYLTNRFNLRKSVRRSVSCSKVLRAVYSRLWIRGSNHRNENNVVVTNNKGRNDQETAELDRFSFASSSTTFNSCSSTASEAEETSTSQKKHHFLYGTNTSQPSMVGNQVKEEAVTERKFRWQYSEESRQLSPVSVLASHRAYPLHGKDSTSGALFHNKASEDSILSASLWKVLFQSANEKNSDSSQRLKSKTVLQQTRQLLFDCVREIVEKQARREKLKREYLASGGLGKHISGDKIRCRGKQSGEESNLAELLKGEMLDSAQEWSGFDSQRKETLLEIGDAIFEEMRAEIVVDMIDCLQSLDEC